MAGARGTGLLFLSLLASGGCTVDPTGPDIAAPDTRGIFVFFPAGAQVTEGLVSGRGFPGAMPEQATHALIESYPTGFEAVVPVAPDGSFEFRVVAISGDVLELRAATSASLDELGAPAFIRVPRTVVAPPEYLCCPETNTCQSEFERELGDPCPVAAPGVRTCSQDVDCAVFENEYLIFEEGQVEVTAPDENGSIVVTGVVEPELLVTLANLGKSAVGAGLDPEERRQLGFDDPGVRRTQISDQNGRFRFESVPAVADDEIIVRLQNLGGYTSPPYALLVPDPPLAGVDVLDVFPWEPLTNGEPGRVGVRISPFGTDDRGICPDAPNAPDGLELCMSGGLTHSMVQITRAQLDREADPGFALQPKAAATSATLPHNRGIEGNVRSKSLDLFVVLDLTAAAARDDPDGFTFDAARSYVRYLRARDRAGIVTFGPEGVQLWSNLTTDRSALDRTLANLASAPRSGEASLFEATELAARQLSARTSRNPGRIVVLTFDPPSGSEEEAREGLDQVLDLVERNPLAAFDGFTVDVVYVSPAPVGSSPTADFLNDLAVFTRGQRVEVPNANTLEESLANLRGDQVGSFILLYDMTIPADVGKAGTVFLDVSVSIPGSDGPRVTSYRGPLRIANAPNP